MILEPLKGTYSHGLIVLPGGFQLGASNSVLRDGTNVSTASGKQFTVTKVSAGLYTVQFIAGFPIPERPFVFPSIHQAAAPTTPCKVHYVKGSWSQSTRSFQVQVMTVGTTPAASDGDAGDRIDFLVIGSILSVGTDPA